MSRPADMTDAEWRDYQACENEHLEDLQDVADREAAIEGEA